MNNDDDEEDEYSTAQEVIDDLYDSLYMLQRFVIESGLTEDQFIEWKKEYGIRRMH